MYGNFQPVKEVYVSVIVPCRNEVNNIDNFINSILRQKLDDIKLEVIIADGMSNDGTKQKIMDYSSRYSNIRFIENTDMIVSIGLNKAIRQAKGELIIRMDVHTDYSEDYILQCVRVINETGADNVGGAARTKYCGYLQRAISIAFHSRFSVGGALFHNSSYEGYVDTVTYGCWLKSTLEKVGLFDEQLVRNQDDELNLRIIRSGGKIYQSASIKSWYYPRSSIRGLFNQYSQYGYWKVRVIQKHRIPASPRHIVPAAFIGTLLVLVFLTPFIYTAGFLLSGLTGIYLLSTVAASFLACRKDKLYGFLPVMPIVFGAYHFGYGYGFIKGIMDFVIFKRNAGKRFTALTR